MTRPSPLQRRVYLAIFLRCGVKPTQGSIQVWRALGVLPSGRICAACFLRSTMKNCRVCCLSQFVLLVRVENLRERLRGLSPIVRLDRTKIIKIHPSTQNTKKIISAISGLVVRFEPSARSEIEHKSGRPRKSGDIHQEFVRTVPCRKALIDEGAVQILWFPN